MPWWAWVLVVIVGVLALPAFDRVVTGVWMRKESAMFKLWKTSPRSRTLTVYLPGILAHGDHSSTPVRSTWLTYGDVLTVSYADNTDPRTVAQLYKRRMYELQAAARVVAIVKNRGYERIVYIGSSMGGQNAPAVAAHVARRVSVTQSLIAVDTPVGVKTLLPFGTLSALLILFPLGRVFDKLIPLPMALPKDDEIQPGLDKDEIKQQARAGFANWPPSLLRDQVVSMALRRFHSSEFTCFGSRVVYLRCTLNNVTVKQPLASERFSHLAAESLYIADVASPHCGYLQLPAMWNDAFDDAYQHLGLPVM